MSNCPCVCKVQFNIRSLWEVELAFCTVHTVSFRATWAVFPYSIVVLCWHGLAQRAEQVFHR